ncbi:MAG: hypothetical protein ACRDTG_31040 [Pseudonocardiaceae bacterium]
MDRRIVLTLLGAGACLPAHEWLLARPEAAVALPRSSGAPVSVGILDDLDDMVARLRRMDDQAGIGQIREAITLAETAQAGYSGATPRIVAICDQRVALAHAATRATSECRRALDSAFDRLNDAPSSVGEPSWCGSQHLRAKLSQVPIGQGSQGTGGGNSLAQSAHLVLKLGEPRLAIIIRQILLSPAPALHSAGSEVR